MPLLAVALPFLTPLLLTPHLLFYYDITPKVALLLLGAALALALASRNLDSVTAFGGTRPGRWFLLAGAASLAVTAVTTLLATHRDLALYGSNWRRMGALTEFAILPVALLLGGYASRSIERLTRLLQAIAAAGLAASLYGIAQYFGFDPVLPAAQYHVGEGIYEIVRPPSTLGHSDYFAAFLIWPVFAGLALRSVFGASAAVTGIVAILLSGSRGATLAVAVGLAILFAQQRPRLRSVAAILAGASLVFAAFYLSPAGQHLRARVHWIGDDPAGGARLLLWRDSLKMAAAKPLTGVGPENFVAEFPRYQSQELERAYPDFYNESPHNLFLDVLTNEGALGLAALLGIIASAFWAARTGPGGSAQFLLPAFAAALLAHQFIVFTAANSFFFYLGAALLAASSVSAPARPLSPPLHYATLAATSVAALCFAVCSYRLVSADAALATIQRHLDAGQPREAAEAYREALSHPTFGLSADLYFSRRFAEAAGASTDYAAKIYYSQVSAGAATLATQQPEGRLNAWYNMAVLSAARRDPSAVEISLRSAIAAAPVWYKPHWTLARLLANQGRVDEARQEGRLALDLNASKDPEVSSTIGEILRSADPRP